MSIHNDLATWAGRARANDQYKIYITTDFANKASELIVEQATQVAAIESHLQDHLKATGKLLYDLCDAYAACNGEDHPAYCEARRFLRTLTTTGDEQ